MGPEKTSSLMSEAKQAAELAYAPYSQYQVGAALETESGKIYRAANIENASFGASVCAERVVLWKAHSEGERSFKRLAIFAQGKSLPYPCGICRQVLGELAENLEVLLSNGPAQESFQLEELIPNPFSL